jgi:hypothetical protein
MAVLFWPARSRFRGDDWWYGEAVWFIFANDELYTPFLLDVLASQFWLVNVATYLTLLIELAFPFLIWQRSTRPYMLAARSSCISSSPSSCACPTSRA